MTAFLTGDIVDDLETEIEGTPHTEPPGRFRALHDQRSGYLNPRYVVIDRPGEFWERIE